MRLAPWQFSIETDCGLFQVEGNCYFITAASFDTHADAHAELSPPVGPCELYEETRRQLHSYFENGNKTLDLPVMTSGTAFQQKVWTALDKIAAGETLTYGQLADCLKTSAQAIGNALRENPVALIIPCHRVVAANGLGGYAGETEGALPAVKECLLRHESRKH